MFLDCLGVFCVFLEDCSLDKSLRFVPLNHGANVDGRNPAPVDRWFSFYSHGCYYIIPGGAGFLPSAVWEKRLLVLSLLFGFVWICHFLKSEQIRKPEYVLVPSDKLTHSKADMEHGP